MVIPWAEIQQWVMTTMETKLLRPLDVYDDGDRVTETILDEYDMWYYDSTCYYFTIFSCKKNGNLLFSYTYDDEVPLTVESIPRIFKEIRRECETVRLCKNCHEYHDLVTPENGGPSMYCDHCYPHVVPQGTYGTCEICHKDTEGVWQWTLCGHVFHYHCLMDLPSNEIYCPVQDCSKMTHKSTYLYI